jgi:1-acyl-sn-glycerol-3-phosphate acyltransferase
VTVFPEGGTFAGDELRAFAGGAFHAARGLDVEVVPVGLAYPAGTEYVEDAFVDHIANIAGNQHVPVGVAVGEPFKPHGAADHAVQKCESAVANLVQQARASIPPYARFVEPA